MATQMSVKTIEDLEPAAVWRFFAEMAAVPRASKKEERICAHVRAVAERHGLDTRTDSAGNLIIKVPATKGCQAAPVTVLQAHLDMVCEKNSDSTHDFDKDPIRLLLDQDSAGEPIVRADGTTLGADNGIGVAMALAAATLPDVVHGPLELLFTLDEESGMTGAKGLTPDSFAGRRMLNLDSEEDGAVYIGCAGGCDTTLSWKFSAHSPDTKCETCHVSVTGLRGGHSGGDIHEGRGNAIKLLARTLLGIEHDALRVGLVNGGSLRNAIPREAQAVVCGPPGTLFALEEAANRSRQESANESGEQHVMIHAEPAKHEKPELILSCEDSRRVLSALTALPDGVVGMHPKVAELVETSNNVATVITSVVAQDGVIRVDVGTLSRSSSSSRLRGLLAQIAAVGRLAGASVETGNEYPGWEPNTDSPILATCRRLYKETFSTEPKVLAIHAGLECGLIGERVGDMDMISIGPRIEGAHSPDERVYINSVQSFWKYLKVVLAELGRDKE